MSKRTTKPKTRPETWTIRPTDESEEIVKTNIDLLCGKKSSERTRRGWRTKLINQALRIAHASGELATVFRRN